MCVCVCVCVYVCVRACVRVCVSLNAHRHNNTTYVVVRIIVLPLTIFY